MWRCACFRKWLIMLLKKEIPARAIMIACNAKNSTILSYNFPPHLLHSYLSAPIFTFRSPTTFSSFPSITIDNSVLERVYSFKYLGLIFKPSKHSPGLCTSLLFKPLEIIHTQWVHTFNEGVSYSKSNTAVGLVMCFLYFLLSLSQSSSLFAIKWNLIRSAFVVILITLPPLVVTCHSKREE